MPQETIYDESKVPAYRLPDPLTCFDGTPVESREAWRAKRRPEILAAFEREMYGRAPGRPKELWFELRSREAGALGGKAVRKEVRIHFTKDEAGPAMDLLIYLPAGAKHPVPVFLGLNFKGNHTVHKDPGISLARPWRCTDVSGKVHEYRPENEPRGSRSSRWPVELILGHGYALATAYYGDIDPDVHDGFRNGVHPLFYKPGQTRPAPDEWGSIAAWAWGLSRALDYFEDDEELDAERTAVIGHSRLGKTALWAAARDERFALAISNNSGCGGAALSRRRFGETVKRINTSFPHWFCGNFKKYNDNEDALPIDQHLLIALIAPRPVYAASASEDLWADPRGEFLSLYHATSVYELLVKEHPKAPDEYPADGSTAVWGRLGYHLRNGRHDLTYFDWKRYLDFADRFLKREDTAGN